MNPNQNFISVGIPVPNHVDSYSQLYPQQVTAQQVQQSNLPQVNYPYPNNSNYYMQTNTQSTPINNQLYIPQEQLAEVKSVLKSGSVFVVCPYCKTPGHSMSKQSISCSNLACCLCFGLVGWISLQAIYKKDINCYDSVHYCKACGNKIGDYKACC
jgi:hypothetical protein